MKLITYPIGIALLILFDVAAAHKCLAQVRPPTFSSMSPYGAKRGTTVAFTIEGTNLGQANHVLFDDSHITGKILSKSDLGPDKMVRAPGSTTAPIEDRASKNRLTVEVTIAPDARLGRHSLRIKTPLGTTNAGTFVIGALSEATEAEPNNVIGATQNVNLPVSINGTIELANDVDHYDFEARAGQCLVFEILASALGSSLDSTLTLLDEKGVVVAGNDDFKKSADSVLSYTIADTGRYIIRVSDALGGGSRRHFYRLTVGALPFVTGVFPLGVPREGGEVGISGFNLGGLQKATVKVPSSESPVDVTTVPVPLPVIPINTVRAAVGNYRESLESEPNDDVAGAQPITLPVTINGRIVGEKGRADHDLYRFQAKKGEEIVFSVMAQRLGSALDSVIEILNARGDLVPRATLRPVWQTFIALNDPNSQQQGIRLESWSGIGPGDYVLIGNELLQVADLPKHPDADVVFKGFRGRRVGFEGTTPEGHALNAPVYKVEVHRPGAIFPPSGILLFQIYSRNDDGGPSYGKDSYLTFTPPEDGEYYVRINDVLGHGGDAYAYRLTVSAANPDFTISVSPANPNVPRGGRVPITITANRLDGFDGRIDVRVKDLPPGFDASRGTILPGETSVTLTLSASESAVLIDQAALKVAGSGEINGRQVVRQADSGGPISVISLALPPDLYIASVTPEQVEITPGGRAKISVKIRRANGFEGRVPLSVLNLPFLLSVPDIGLNGILITEKEESRDFYVVAEPKAEPSEQTIFVVGRVETNSPQASEHASVPIKLRVVSKQTAGAR